MISYKSCYKIHTKSIETSVSRVFYLHNILQFVINGLYQRTFAEHQFASDIH